MSYTIYIKNQERAKSPIDKKQVENWVDEFTNWLFDINQEYNNYRFFQNKEKMVIFLLVGRMSKYLSSRGQFDDG